MFYEYLNEQTIPAICGIIYCILLYLDTKLNNVNRTTKDYVKSFIILYALSYLAIYLYDMKPISNNLQNILTPAVVREEIYTGVPGF